MSQDTQEQETLQRAAHLIKTSDIDRARPLLKEYLRAHPQDARAWYLASFVTENRSQQISYLERAVRLVPQLQSAQNRLAQLRSEPETEPGSQPAPAVSPPADAPSMAAFRERGFPLVAVLSGLLVVAVLALIFIVFARLRGSSQTGSPIAVQGLVTVSPTQAPSIDTPLSPTLQPATGAALAANTVPGPSPIVYIEGATLHAINPDGSGHTTLTDFTVFPPESLAIMRDFDVSWSPDGRRVVFHDFPPDYEVQSELFPRKAPGLFTMDAAGWDQHFVGRGYNPVWSPDGGRLAFASPQEFGKPTGIYTVNADGSNLVRLTAPGDRYENRPTWSPDGLRIAFQRSEPGQSIDDPKHFSVYVIKVDGSAETRLTAGMNPVWSPDGKHIAFWDGESVWLISPEGTDRVSLNVNRPGEIIWSPDNKYLAVGKSIVQLDGSGVLVQAPRDEKSLVPDTPSLMQALDLAQGLTEPRCAWSPDSQYISFRGEPLPVSGPDDLHIMDLNGRVVTVAHKELGVLVDVAWLNARQQAGLSEVLSLSATPDPEGYGIYSGGSSIALLRGAKITELPVPGSWVGPSWSPDGKQVVFWRNVDKEAAIVQANADGSNATTLVSPGWMPLWSPDGKHIAFLRGTKDDKDNLYIMDADGLNPVLVIDKPVSTQVDEPVWSPDGSRIAFTVGVNPSTRSIYLANADGSNAHSLAPALAMSSMPAWSPDGKRLVFVESVKTDRPDYDYYLTTINGDGSSLRRLAKDYYRPVWSPDGKSIAVNSISPGGIYVMQADGSNPRLLTGLQRAYGPSWSPDGQWIAYVVDYGDSIPGTGGSIYHLFIIPTGRSSAPRRLPIETVGTAPVIWLHVASLDAVEQVAKAAPTAFLRVTRPVTAVPNAGAGLTMTVMAQTIVATATPNATRLALRISPTPSSSVRRDPTWRLTATPTRTRTATATPEPPCGTGNQILLAKFGAPHQTGLYSMNSDGSSPCRLYPKPVKKPAWSRDGKQIVFEGDRHLIIINADGSNPHILNNTAGATDPAWSPDGRQIAFTAIRDTEDAYKLYGLWLIDVDTSQRRQVVKMGVGLVALCSPDWSPDGKRIAFVSENYRIYIVDRDGSDLKALTPQRTDGAGPVTLSWSPDGKYIAFALDNRELLLMKADGADLRPLKAGDTPLRGLSLSWSPDSQHIVFVDESYAVHVVRMDGSDLHTLALYRDGSGSVEVAWQPSNDTPNAPAAP